MKKPNVLIEILKLIGLVILGWLLWIIIFSVTITPESSEIAQELFPGSAFLFGILTAIFIIFGMKFNQVHRIRQDINGKRSNIQIVTDRSDRLLEKANRVVEKYMTHEHDTLTEVTSERTAFRQSEKNTRFHAVSTRN